ncbi:hypothetical protein WA026_022239 [Henosepilachna vigintioctopunctata]|uniref:Uncharacterized protein n=1 Tax=Henosepilachna vigintioctopunctata TaxID=420089 RepID=A0AAW1UJC8_9CUCU
MKRCINCVEANTKYNLNYETDHNASSRNCPSHEYLMDIERSEINYGSINGPKAQEIDILKELDVVDKKLNQESVDASSLKVRIDLEKTIKYNTFEYSQHYQKFR